MRGELTPEEEARSFRRGLGRLRHDGRGHRASCTPRPGTARTTFRRASARTCRSSPPSMRPAGSRPPSRSTSGKKVLDANAEIIEDLRAAGALLHVDPKLPPRVPALLALQEAGASSARRSSGSSGWTTRTSTCGERALEAIRRVTWVPAWGEARIGGMVANRREWVISRQRRWGSPITLLYAMRDGERAEVYPWKDSPAETQKFFERVVEIIRREGGDAWYARPAEDFLPPDADRRGFSAFEKETDILDVWFDSGVSHMAVLRSGQWPELNRDGPGPPADVYLEGHDQHRGWFQSSLLTSVALYGDAPYRERDHARVLPGRLGPEDVQVARQRRRAGGRSSERYGADILRLWVCALDYRDDTPISEEILARCAEGYRKIRNTARYLVSNLYDFDPAADSLRRAELLPLDRWTLGRGPAGRRPDPPGVRGLRVPRRVSHARQLLRDGAFGLLPRHRQGPPLCLGAASRERRSAQTVMYRIGRAIATLAAPCSPSRPRRSGRPCPSPKEESVHLARFETLDDAARDIRPRPGVGKADAIARGSGRRARASPQGKDDRVLPGGGGSPDAPSRRSRRDRAATGHAGAGARRPLHRVGGRAGLGGGRVRQGSRSAAYPGLSLRFAKAPGRRCDRCWKVTPEAEETGLCARCRAGPRETAWPHEGAA